MPGGRMHHHAGRFVDDDEVLVLVEDGKRERFWLRHRIDRLVELDADSLSCLHRLVRPGPAACDVYEAFLNQALNLRP